MSSDHEEFVLKLFDFFWFEHGIFSREAKIPLVHDKDDDEEVVEAPAERLLLSRTPTMIVRSFSDQGLCSKDESSSDSSTPKSVLSMPKLQTILSGKEAEEFLEAVDSQGCLNVAVEKRVSDRNKRKRRRRISSSRSLSELEYEELKGFMDLGFVFSDEDKDSNLVSIIPGLQRFGRNDENCEEEKKGFHESSVSRPYLSEAWEVLEKKTTENPLMNWRIPAFGNEMELKDHLKFWAHTVASTVR